MEPAPPSLATCGIDGKEETPAWGRVYVSRNYPKQTFAARVTVAELSKSTDVQLMQQGYVAIGWVEVTRLLRSHPYGKPGENIPGPASAQAVALQEAARIGGELLLRLKKDHAMMLVEHDMRLVMNISDRVHVLSRGRTLAEGTPAEIQRHPDVIAAYLGAPADA